MDINHYHSHHPHLKPIIHQTLFNCSSFWNTNSTRHIPGLFARGEGGTTILTVTGTCRWTGYDFAVITIDTGYLNRPIGYWRTTPFITGCFPAHNAGFPAHNVYVRPAISAPATRRRVRDGNRFLWMYELCMMIHSRIESPSVPVQGMHMKVFSKVYCDRVYFFLCAETVWDRVRFSPPPPQRHPHPSKWESSAPPPPPPPPGWFDSFTLCCVCFQHKIGEKTDSLNTLCGYLVPITMCRGGMETNKLN